jgi:DNA-binding transcriptional LysR family regulator
MARTEWLRTFVCAYQLGSITEAARARHLSQPAATGHVRSLEAAAGTDLFVRRRDGVVPTDGGRRLYAEIADPLDRLSGVLHGLDQGALPIPRSPVRVGASPEVFAGFVVERLEGWTSPVTAVFGNDDDLHRSLREGDADLVVSTTSTTRRDTTSEVVSHHHYALVAPPGMFGPHPSSPAELAAVLAGAPWTSYSSDLPRTRGFWKKHLGRPFDACLRLVAPDLRVVLSAVEAGVGASLLPTMVCDPAIRRGSVTELFPVRDLVAPHPLWASVRTAHPRHAELDDLVSRLRREPRPPAPRSGRDASAPRGN